MTQIEELEIAVGSLPEKEYRRFRRWFLERDWDKWDQQITEDSMSGKLDILIQDTLSIDNELASGKAMLDQCLEDFYRCSHVMEEFQNHTPVRPQPDAEAAEIETYKMAVALHIAVMEDCR